MTDVAARLRIRPGDRVLVLGGEPSAGRLIGPLPTGARSVELPEPAEVVILFVEDEPALRATLPLAAAAATHDGLLWVAYRKGEAKAGTGLDRDRLTALSDEIAALTGVSLVAVDATWSAMRLRPSERYRT